MIFENMDRIIFAGDSVTDMGSISPVGEDPFAGGTGLGNGYVRMISNFLNAWYPELTLRLTNSGISGNTSRDLLNRWERDVINLHPQWISICIGINDVWRRFDRPALTEFQVSLEEYEKNVETMVKSSKSVAKGVFLMTPYFMEPQKNDKLRICMDQYGIICRKIAEMHQVTLIDLQAMFDRYFKYRHPIYVAGDRVHPNAIGATLIARAFLLACGFDFSKID